MGIEDFAHMADAHIITARGKIRQYTAIREFLLPFHVLIEEFKTGSLASFPYPRFNAFENEYAFDGIDGISFPRRGNANLLVGLPIKAHRRGLAFLADLDVNTNVRLFEVDYDEF